MKKLALLVLLVACGDPTGTDAWDAEGDITQADMLVMSGSEMLDVTCEVAAPSAGFERVPAIYDFEGTEPPGAYCHHYAFPLVQWDDPAAQPDTVYPVHLIDGPIGGRYRVMVR